MSLASSRCRTGHRRRRRRAADASVPMPSTDPTPTTMRQHTARCGAAIPALTAILLLAVATACAPLPGPGAALTADRELGGFIDRVHHALEAHAWQEIIGMADPQHHRIQVVEHGMPEAQYVAELFGLHRVDNNVSPEGPPGWDDLGRIRSVRLRELDDAGERYRLHGEVTLADGRVLDLQATIARTADGYVLTGGVG